MCCADCCFLCHNILVFYFCDVENTEIVAVGGQELTENGGEQQERGKGVGKNVLEY